MKGLIRLLERGAYLCVLLYCASALLTCLIPFMPATTVMAPLWYVLLFFPKWWAIILFIVALPGAVRFGRYGVAVVLLFAGAQLFFYGGYRLHPLSASPVENSLAVVTLNTGEGALDLPRLESWLQQHPMDLIVLQELKNEDPIEQIFPPEEWHVLRREKLTVVSRYPLEFVEDLKRSDVFEGEGYGLVYAVFDVKYEDGESLRLMNVHLDTPRDGLEPFLHRSFDLTPLRENFRRRSYEGRLLAEAVDRMNAEVLLGDFNMLYESPLFQSLFDGYTDAFNAKGSGFGATKFTAWHAVRIDHVLVAPSVVVESASVGMDLGSDHRPLSVRLALP